MIELYGIGNCDSCRKARKWLDQTGRDFHWHDLRIDGLSRGSVRDWIEAVGLERLVNRRSATWRGLSEHERAGAMDPERAPELLARHPTLVKRPVIVAGNRVWAGFDDSVMEAL